MLNWLYFVDLLQKDSLCSKSQMTIASHNQIPLWVSNIASVSPALVLLAGNNSTLDDVNWSSNYPSSPKLWHSHPLTDQTDRRRECRWLVQVGPAMRCCPALPLTKSIYRQVDMQTTDIVPSTCFYALNINISHDVQEACHFNFHWGLCSTLFPVENLFEAMRRL